MDTRSDFWYLRPFRHLIGHQSDVWRWGCWLKRLKKDKKLIFKAVKYIFTFLFNYYVEKSNFFQLISYLFQPLVRTSHHSDQMFLTNLNLTLTKKGVQNCEVKAVSHSSDVKKKNLFFLSLRMQLPWSGGEIFRHRRRGAVQISWQI